MAEKNVTAKNEKRDLPAAALRVFPLASALLYFYSFFFDAGVLAHFGIPSSQVRIGLELLGNAAAALWLSLFIGFGSLPLNFYYWPSTQTGFYSVFLGFLIVLVTARIVLAFDLPSFLLSFPLFVGIIWAYFGSIYWRRGGWVPSRTGKPPQVYDARSELHKGTIADYFVGRHGFDPLFFIFVFLLFTPAAFMFCGWMEGKRLKEIDSFSIDDQVYGIVRIYGDRVISVPLNSDGEVIPGSYIVVPSLEAAEVKSFAARF